MQPNDKNPLKQKSFKFILAGVILLFMAGIRFIQYDDFLLGTVESLLAIGLVLFGLKLKKGENKK
ncbi:MULTISPECIES: hypothetical protein [Xenorhabdus]|uniref:Uncharacterized protein n=2 Tax=Xenorhabdus TaxID=626 RepID=A0A2G0Q618_XENHO|nr:MULTISPECIES: hypothetical protein [Xenorhabdus]AOM39554.1 hypothetical protein A9255_02445 [Xenorhabdus hominickii]MDC9596186.1 hypothetical protein [Xenorhabdus anantnagensis]PHM54669.1 hypothetical protein Xhom_02620 [Xenorhabdus hominickii]